MAWGGRWGLGAVPRQARSLRPSPLRSAPGCWRRRGGRGAAAGRPPACARTPSACPSIPPTCSVRRLNSEDLPTLGSPRMPIFRLLRTRPKRAAPPLFWSASAFLGGMAAAGGRGGGRGARRCQGAGGRRCARAGGAGGRGARPGAAPVRGRCASGAGGALGRGRGAGGAGGGRARGGGCCCAARREKRRRCGAATGGPWSGAQCNGGGAINAIKRRAPANHCDAQPARPPLSGAPRRALPRLCPPHMWRWARPVRDAWGPTGRHRPRSAATPPRGRGGVGARAERPCASIAAAAAELLGAAGGLARRPPPSRPWAARVGGPEGRASTPPPAAAAAAELPRGPRQIRCARRRRSPHKRHVGAPRAAGARTPPPPPAPPASEMSAGQRGLPGGRAGRGQRWGGVGW
jgi:hypothetical protein